jgi:DNA-binding response OmpR family regulator
MPVERSVRVMLVDSSPLALRMLKKRISMIHPKWLVWTAETGAEALEKISSVDVLITELDLADMPGEELLRCVAARHDGPVCIIHTAHAERAHGLGPLAHRALVKPCDDGVLFPAVSSALRLRREARRWSSRRRRAI